MELTNERPATGVSSAIRTRIMTRQFVAPQQMFSISANRPAPSRSLTRRISHAVGVVSLDRSAVGSCLCGRLRFLARRAPASVVFAGRRVQSQRDAATLPAGQQTAVADVLAA